MRRFLALQYARNLAILLGAFVLLYLLIDVMINHKKLDLNSNIFLLYALFTAITAAYFVLPACILLAMLATKAQLLSRNEYIALRALGLSPRGFAAPMMALALAVCAVFCAASFSRAAYASEYKSNILRTGTLSAQHRNILLKTATGELLYAASARDDELFDALLLVRERGHLKRALSAARAEFARENLWEFYDAVWLEFESADAGANSSGRVANPGASGGVSDGDGGADGGERAQIIAFAKDFLEHLKAHPMGFEAEFSAGAGVGVGGANSSGRPQKTEASGVVSDDVGSTVGDGDGANSDNVAEGKDVQIIGQTGQVVGNLPAKSAADSVGDGSVDKSDKSTTALTPPDAPEKATRPEDLAVAKSAAKSTAKSAAKFTTAAAAKSAVAQTPQIAPKISKITRHEKLQISLQLRKEVFAHQLSESLSLLDAWRLLGSLSDHALVRTSIYLHAVYPLVSVLLGAALLPLLGIYSRFSELSLSVVLAVFIGLLVFGCQNLLLRFTQNGALSPELGILLPSAVITAICGAVIWRNDQT